MEQMLGQKMRPAISLAKFLSDYQQETPLEHFPQTDEDIQEAMNLLDDDTRFFTTAENCSLFHLDQIDDPRVTQFIPGFTEMHRKNKTHIPSDALKLRTFKTLLKSKETSARSPFQRSQETFKMTQFPSNNGTDENCELYNELLVTVRVYRPARATHVGQTLEKPVFAEEFICLGSNLLTELRDKMSCVCNKKRFFDISNDTTADLPEKLTDPGYFFITDTFYNDKRNPDNVDYSEAIRKWANKASGLRELKFKVAKMEETRFIDLTISLGFPQLYQHHGNCEHVFTFAQVELLTPSAQILTKSQYPHLRSFGLYNNRLCNMCGVMHYVFIVENSDRQLHDPAYLCKKCFYSYHYVDGKKIGQFKAYRVNDFEENSNLLEIASQPSPSSSSSNNLNNRESNGINQSPTPSNCSVENSFLILDEIDENNHHINEEIEFISCKKEKD